jgi:SAM-dependent methyltransferase
MKNRARLLRDIKEDANYLGWDKIAPYRDNQLRSGIDISYHQVLVPEVMRLLKRFKCNRILDVGCGTGVLTEKIASESDFVCGVDISPVSINIAKASKSLASNIEYHISAIDKFNPFFKSIGEFDIAVANMVLMDVINLRRSLDSIFNLLNPKGALIATITHPCFWPDYWGYGNELWFNYYDELQIAHPFVTHTDRVGIAETVHVHRPLEFYLQALCNAGFKIDYIGEPLPVGPVPKDYLTTMKRPRFLSFLCRKP